MKSNIKNLVINVQNCSTKVGIVLRRKLHPIILKMMPSRRNFDFVLLNEKPQKEGATLYIPTHSTCHDAPIVCEALQDHFYVLVGRQPLELMDRVFFWLNGVVYVDRDNPISQKKAFNKMIQLLNLGTDVVSFSEQTWCTKESTPINHLRRGWFNVAEVANVPVVPLALEYYEHTGDNVCYGKFGDSFKVNEFDNKIDKTNELEDIFATLKFDIWNQFPQRKRADVDNNEWQEIIRKRMEEYPKLDSHREQKYVIGFKNDPDYVLKSQEFLKGIEKLDDLQIKDNSDEKKLIK